MCNIVRIYYTETNTFCQEDFMERSILHCDMNNFYASVERIYHPELCGKPIAVCGDESKRCGIVLAKSDEAKRFGIKTGETVWQAKEKCPDLITIPTHFDRYLTYSAMAREIYCEYTDLVEPFGMDECWLDVTASRLAFGDGKSIGTELKEKIKRELGLTVSVGVSFNKVFAKLGSDMKKPDALTYIPSEKFRETVWPLPVEEMLFVGPKSAKILHRFEIHTIGQLANANDLFLSLQFGKNGEKMKRCAQGLDQSPVLPSNAEPPLKSIGHGMTTPEDLTNEDQIRVLILALVQEVGEKLRFYRRFARGISLECKDRHFFVKSLQTRLDRPTNCTATLARAAFRLFRERYFFREPLRALSVRAIDLVPMGEAVQLSMFDDEREWREEALDRVSDQLRKRYGKKILRPASLLSFAEEESDYVPFAAPR